ncbi:MAG: TolC family protein [Bacteroidota bacterium]
MSAKMFRSATLLLVLLLSTHFVKAQERNDSLPPVLELPQLYQWMALYHPVVQQLDLTLDMADQGIRKAKGAFDPKLKALWDQKVFDEKDYYRYLEAGIELPTRTGISVKGGYEQNQGIFLNPEANVPDEGLLNLGLIVPVGQGLFIDQRRATLQQAQQYRLLSEVERQHLLNNLLLDASTAWLEWQLAYRNVEIWSEAVQLASVRLQASLESYRARNLAAVDTLEASLNYQDRLVGQQSALLEYQQAALTLGNFLWVEEVPQPQLALNYRPSELADDILPEIMIDFEASLHPQFQVLRYEGEILEIERRWKAEQLKPQLDVQYNILQTPVGNPEGMVINPNNYKLGVNFSFPLFLRKERAGLAQTKIKQEMLEQKQDQKLLELENKRTQYLRQFQIYSEQRQLYRNMTSQYEMLLQAERSKFRAGNSSIFLLNSRELKLIDAQLKLLKAETQVIKARVGLLWSEGRLWEQL